jgi:hypothetical protein
MMLWKGKLFGRFWFQSKSAVLTGFFDANLTGVFGQSEMMAFERRQEFERQLDGYIPKEG